MADRPGNPASGPVRKPSDLFTFLVVVVVTVIAYAPMLDSVIRLSLRTTQAVNAFVFIAFAFLEAFRTARRQGGFRPQADRFGFLLFSAACLLLMVASLSALWPMAVLALCFNLAALFAFGFGRKAAAAFYPALAGFGTAVALLILVPGMDGWLRLVAAKCAAPVFALLDIKAQVQILHDPLRVGLWVEKGITYFDVATECNGFGILLSSVVLSVIVSWRRGYSWPLRLALALLSAAMGLGFNVLRIVAIGWASLNTMLDYAWIHEGLGALVYLTALVAVYALVSAPRFSSRRTEPGASDGGGTSASNQSVTAASNPTPRM